MKKLLEENGKNIIIIITVIVLVKILDLGYPGKRIESEKVQKKLDKSYPGVGVLKSGDTSEFRAIQVKILEEKELKKYPNLVGRWVVNESNYLSILNSVVRIYKEKGIYYQSMIFDKDNSESIMKLSKKSKIRFDVVGKSDYLLISPSGNLMFWDEQGFLLTCKQINIEDID
jgi:hypothetical protein